MNRFLNVRWRAGLAAAVFSLAGVPAPAAPPAPFFGTWIDAAGCCDMGEAKLTIEGNTVTWNGTAKTPAACSTTFALEKEAAGTVYRDARGRRFLAGMPGSLPTFLLRIDPRACGGRADRIRVSFPLAYDKRHIELSEYRDGRPVGYRRLVRID
jgi:hypothetical protein